MKKLIYLLPLVAVFFSLQSCLKQPEPIKWSEEDDAKFFDFATTKEFQLDVNYKTKFAVDFEVYSEYPYTTYIQSGVTLAEFKGITKISQKGEAGRIEPIFRAITDDKGSFSGKMTMPTAFTKVWIHSKYMGVPEIIELNVDQVGLSISFNNGPMAAQAKVVSRANSSAPNGVKVLGDWDNLGVPSYKLAERAVVPTTLFHNLMYSLPEAQTINSKYLGKETNIVLTEKSKINLAFVHYGGTITSCLGYYSYETGTTPTEASLNKIVAFPNVSYAYEGGNLSTGDQIALKYWNPNTNAFEDEFPANQTIGFFLYPAGFNTSNYSVAPIWLGTIYSNNEFNGKNGSGKYYQQVVMLEDQSYNYDDATQSEVKILAIEDLPLRANLGYPDDYNDIILLVKIKGASKDVPEIDPDPNPDPKPDPIDNYIVVKGTLAFEDMWPWKGDYDMNDVVIEYHSTVMRDKNNNVIGMIDSLRPRWSGAEFHNGFGYELGNLKYSDYKNLVNIKVRTNYNASSSGTVDDGRRFTKGYFGTVASSLEQGPIDSKMVIMVFEDIKDMVPDYNQYRLTGALPGQKPKPSPQYYFTIVTSFSTENDYNNHPSMEDLTSPPYNPFTVVTDQKQKGRENDNSPEYRRGHEIHLPKYAPTKRGLELGLGSIFHTADDMSYPPHVYYVSKFNYPWAINIPIYNWNFPIEEKRVDNVSYGYPRFSNWVESNGMQDQDWYKHPGDNIGTLPN